MANFTYFDPKTMGNDVLIDALLAKDSHIEVNKDSVKSSVDTFTNEESGNGYSLSTYDGGIPELNMDAGLFLTSGNANPPLKNTSPSYSTEFNLDSKDTKALSSSESSIPLVVANSPVPDVDLQATATKAFSGSGKITDTTLLEFNFTVNDLYAKGVKFDLMFGTDEYPEYNDSPFVDIGGVYLNGKNVALFNESETQPLSVVSENLKMGNFRDNSDSTLPIEYDGISNKLTIYAPIKPGENSIKIGVADTGDNLYDSGLFIANMQETQLRGSGLNFVTSGTDSSDNLVGKENNNETFETGAGNDIVKPGEGNDIVLTDEGDDIIYGGFGNDQIDGGFGMDEVSYENTEFNPGFIKILDNETIKIDTGKNEDTLLNVENVKFKDDLDANTNKEVVNTEELLIEDNVAKIYIAYFGRAADADGLNYWQQQVTDEINNRGPNETYDQAYDRAIENVVDAFANSNEAETIYPGISKGNMDDKEINEFVNNIYKNLFNRDADDAGLKYWTDEVKVLQENGTPVGTIIKTVINGAQDSAGQLDRTLMQNKSQVSWNYAKQYEFADKEWDQDKNYDEAANILDKVTADESSVDSVYDNILSIIDTGKSILSIVDFFL